MSYPDSVVLLEDPSLSASYSIGDSYDDSIDQLTLSLGEDEADIMREDEQTHRLEELAESLESLRMLLTSESVHSKDTLDIAQTWLVDKTKTLNTEAFHAVADSTPLPYRTALTMEGAVKALKATLVYIWERFIAFLKKAKAFVMKVYGAFKGLGAQAVKIGKQARELTSSVPNSQKLSLTGPLATAFLVNGRQVAPSELLSDGLVTASSTMLDKVDKMNKGIKQNLSTTKIEPLAATISGVYKFLQTEVKGERATKHGETEVVNNSIPGDKRMVVTYSDFTENFRNVTIPKLSMYLEPLKDSEKDPVEIATLSKEQIQKICNAVSTLSTHIERMNSHEADLDKTLSQAKWIQGFNRIDHPKYNALVNGGISISRAIMTYQMLWMRVLSELARSGLHVCQLSLQQYK